MTKRIWLGHAPDVAQVDVVEFDEQACTILAERSYLELDVNDKVIAVRAPDMITDLAPEAAGDSGALLALLQAAEAAINSSDIPEFAELEASTESPDGSAEAPYHRLVVTTREQFKGVPFDDPNIVIGVEQGQGSGLVRLETGDDEVHIRVERTGGPAEEGRPSFCWEGAHADNTLQVIDGFVGTAVFAFKTAQLAKCVQRGGLLRLGDGTASHPPIPPAAVSPAAHGTASLCGSSAGACSAAIPITKSAPSSVKWNIATGLWSKTKRHPNRRVMTREAIDAGIGSPLYLPRREPVHIITGRRERHREVTLAWLKKWHVSVASLTMMGNDDRREIAEYKAENVKLFAATAHQRPFGEAMFVESCPKQAQRIAKLSRVLTVCPATSESHMAECF